MSLKYRISLSKNRNRTRQKDNTELEQEVDGHDNAAYENEAVINNLKKTNGTTPDSVNISLADSQELYENLDRPSSSFTSSSGDRNPWDEVVFESQEEETKWLTWMESQLKRFTGEEGDKTEITLEQFKEALGLKQSFFAERFFHLCDSNNSGTTSIYNLIAPLIRVTKGTTEQRLKFLFDVYDVDGNGSLEIEEFMIVLESCMAESSVKLSKDDLEQLTAVLFEATDSDNSGSITFEEFKNELTKHPGVIENLTISAALWLKPENKKKKEPTCQCCSKYFSKTYFANNLRKLLFYVWFVYMNLFLAGYAAYNYWAFNGFVIVARMCGLPLNFNCTLILVLMLRKSLTFLRLTFLNQFLPLDHNILFHKRVGILIGIMSLIHTGAHVGNAVLLSESGDLTTGEILFTTVAGFGTVGGGAMITGWLLDIIVIIMIICSLPFVRRSGHFEVFYWTHILYVPFWVMLIFHGPNFWKWFIAPGIIFLGEKISRLKWIKQARYGKTYIEEITLLPSSVTHLEISRPDNFAYQPGDYIFIQIPAVSKHEWHPFTISSAPELEGRIWLHVRSAGNWTKSLYKYFDQFDPGENFDVESRDFSFDRELQTSIRRATLRRNNNTKVRTLSSQSKRKSKDQLDAKRNPKEIAREQRIALRNKKVKVQCYIDGPYGTATREIFQTEHAILVGGGIGVTPMASILQSIMYKYKASMRMCPKCNHEWFGEFTTDAMKLKKVDFFWINRDQRAFEWFISLLTALEVEQSIGNEDNHAEKIIDMHLYMTAAVKKTDMKGIGLQIALDLMHEKINRDLITGLKVRTQPGRPDWNKEFKDISERKKGKVKVYFCGAPQLGKTIKAASEKYGFDFAKENF